MSELTDEFVDAILELADEIGEGLQATLLTRPTAAYDPATSRYSEPVGEPVEVTFACPPESAPKDAPGNGDEADRAAIEIIMPRTLDANGALVVPKRGDQLRLRGTVYQIVRVDPIAVGDERAGFVLGVR